MRCTCVLRDMCYVCCVLEYFALRTVLDSVCSMPIRTNILLHSKRTH